MDVRAYALQPSYYCQAGRFAGDAAHLSVAVLRSGSDHAAVRFDTIRVVQKTVAGRVDLSNGVGLGHM